MKITLQTQETIKISGIQGPVEDSEFKQHLSNFNNPHAVTASQAGLGNVDNTSDINKPISTAQQAALDNKADLINGIIPSTQLPSYIDDVLEYADFAGLPATGEASKIYVVLDTNLTYRWSGSAYVEVSKSLALGETSLTAYRGDFGKTAYDHSQLAAGNPHNVSKTEIGLGNVDNTSDINKPISTAQQSALDLKAPIDSSGELYEYNQNGSIITVAAAETFYKWLTAVVGLTSGGDYLTGSDVNDNLVVGAQGAGKYAVDFDCAFSAKTGTMNKIAVFKSGIRQDNLTSLRKMPAGGELYPSSISVTAGTLAQGSVSDLQNADGVYIQIQESNTTPKGIDIELTWTGIADFQKLRFLGRQDGAASCLMKFQLWNYNTSAWENMTASAQDLFSATTSADYIREFETANMQNYISGGQVKARIHHAGTTYSTGHYLWVDKIALIKRDSDLLASGSGILNLAAGDTLDLRGTSDTAGTEIKIYSMNLRIERIRA